MATFFDISLDHLVKGDITKMKEHVTKSEVDLASFNKHAMLMKIGRFSILSTAFPLLYFLDD